MPILLGQEYGDYTGGTPGWNLNTGAGPRQFDKVVTFQTSLCGTPVVQVNLGVLDADAQPNLRVRLQALNITSVGFTLRIATWADTKLYAVGANWIAVSS
jgi:H-type lectin domain-containing protein